MKRRPPTAGQKQSVEEARGGADASTGFVDERFRLALERQLFMNNPG
jgi:hypothetical protein